MLPASKDIFWGFPTSADVALRVLDVQMHLLLNRFSHAHQCEVQIALHFDVRNMFENQMPKGVVRQ